MTIEALLSLLSDGGVLALLVFILYGGQRKWWIWGWVYREKVSELNEWKQLYLKTLPLVGRLIKVVEPSNSDDSSN